MSKQKYEQGRVLKLPERGISPDPQKPPLSARNQRRLAAKLERRTDQSSKKEMT